jgi:hypothetical protein
LAIRTNFSKVSMQWLYMVPKNRQWLYMVPKNRQWLFQTCLLAIRTMMGARIFPSCSSNVAATL